MKEAYDYWLKNVSDLELKNTLLKMSAEDIEEAFGTEIAFGTGGLRGIMGIGTSKINIYTIRKVTQGFSDYLKAKYLKEIKIAIAYDNRMNSKTFAEVTAKVFSENGIKSFIYEELMPTPMLSFAVRYLKCHGGIMITASHNPKEYNGYKVYNQSGAQVALDEASNITRYIDKVNDYFSFKKADSSLINKITSDVSEKYFELVRANKINNPKKDAKIVFSPLHGTGKIIVPFLKSEGYNIVPYLPQMVSDPNFSKTKSSNPEDESAYEGVLSLSKSLNADALLITDPDADRLGVAVLHNDEYVLLNGNQTGAIELNYILEHQKYSNGYVFVTNVTSELIKKIAESSNMKVTTTLTGFKFIGEQATLIEGKGEYVFGCEESYGSLVADFVRDKDAVQACYLLSEIINYLKAKKMTLVDYLDLIYQKYGYFEERTFSIALDSQKGLSTIHKIMSYFQKNPLAIKNHFLVGYDDLMLGLHYQNNKTTAISLPKSDVLKYYFQNDLWVAIRPSGTEPKLKIYMGVQDISKEKAQSKINEITSFLKEEIRRIENAK